MHSCSRIYQLHHIRHRHHLDKACLLYTSVEVIEKNSIKMQNEKLKPYYREYIQAVMDISKSYQESIVNCDTYGYQGVLGAFSHIATQRLFPHGKMKNYAAFEGAVNCLLYTSRFAPFL